MSVRPGTRLDGRYRLSDRLAYGGMGEVWRATDEVLSREVAVKILRPELAEDEAFVRRFRAEARTTSGLPHNGIAAVYDYGETRVGADGSSPARYDDPEADPVAYLVMELVPGEALSSILSRDGALGTDRMLDFVAQAARALHAAHQRGVIHRDIKPANLMVTPDGRVKVTDFGIARPLDHEPLTATGQVMGTAHYLAPELAKGQEASPLSDVYALGVVAYECIAGHRPFEGDNQVAVALAHLNEQPPPLPGTVPEPVRAVIASAMEKDPQRRMPSAEAFAAALETLRYRQPGEDGMAPGSGVLPGSPAELGLATAGLLAPEHRGWSSGIPGTREGTAVGATVAPPPVAPAPPSSGTYSLGPTNSLRTAPLGGTAHPGYGAPPTGGGAGGTLGGPTAPPSPYAGYGYPADPFRTPTAPGGISVTPGGRADRRRSGIGPVLAAAAVVLAMVVLLVTAWRSGMFADRSPTSVPSDGASPTASTSNPIVAPTTATSTPRRTSHTTSPRKTTSPSSPTTSPTSTGSSSGSPSPTQASPSGSASTSPPVSPSSSASGSTAPGTSTTNPTTPPLLPRPTGTGADNR